MGRQFAIIGLGTFGIATLEKLSEATEQIIIVDKDRDRVEKYKHLAAKSYITDALNRAVLEKIVPESIDVAVVDVGGNIEAAIVIITALKNLAATEIIVRADDEERGSIYELVGATRVVYPAREAATKIVPMLVSSSLFSFMPISKNLVLAEVRLPERYVGQTLVEANLRQSKGINVVALRKEKSEEYDYFDPRYRLQADDVLLCVGEESSVTAFTGARVAARKNAIGEMLKGIFGKPKQRNGETGGERA